MTDYQVHLQRLEIEIVSLRHEIAALSTTVSGMDLQSRLFYREFQLLSLTGDLSQLRALNDDIEAFTASSLKRSDLWLIQAHIALKLHRVTKAQQLLNQDTARSFCPQGRLVQADLHIQHGRYNAAGDEIELVLTEDITWDALARKAYLTGLLGDVDKADKLYISAQEELTAKQIHAYAWIEVQRGILDFQRGRSIEALAHYRHAGKAYSGYWLIEERIAEVKGSQGNFSDAIAKYEDLYEYRSRPEWAHALGDLYLLSGAISMAHDWKMRALDQYLRSASSGEIHYYHYLVDLCCELLGQNEAALTWAIRDHELRSNYQTQQNLAWALYRCGKVSEAETWISKALESNVICARLYLYAACIYGAAGKMQLSTHYFQRSKSINAAPVKASLSVNMADARLSRASSLRAKSAASITILQPVLKHYS